MKVLLDLQLSNYQKNVIRDLFNQMSFIFTDTIKNYPKLVTLMIGTNDSGSSYDETVSHSEELEKFNLYYIKELIILIS